MIFFGQNIDIHFLSKYLYLCIEINELEDEYTCGLDSTMANNCRIWQHIFDDSLLGEIFYSDCMLEKNNMMIFISKMHYVQD